MRHCRIDVVRSTVFLICVLFASLGHAALNIVPKKVQFGVVDVDGIAVVFPIGYSSQSLSDADIPIINGVYGDASVVSNGSETQLTLRGANSAGISINRFESFDLSGAPLRIINDAGSSPESNGAAQLIVIVADNINLDNEVEIVAPWRTFFSLRRRPTQRLDAHFAP